MTIEQLEQHVLLECCAEPIEIKLEHNRLKYMISRRESTKQLLLHDSHGRCWATQSGSPLYDQREKDSDMALSVHEQISGYTMNGYPLSMRFSWSFDAVTDLGFKE